MLIVSIISVSTLIKLTLLCSKFSTTNGTTTSFPVTTVILGTVSVNDGLPKTVIMDTEMGSRVKAIRLLIVAPSNYPSFLGTRP